MPAPTPSRTAALETLRAIRRGVLAGAAIEYAAAHLDVRDRAWVQELVYGTLRLRGRLDHRLAALSSRTLDSLDADVLDTLRLGAYQLTEMGGVPAYAAISQSVDLAATVGGRGRGAAGFVNGVLRSLRRTGAASTFPTFEADPAAHLTTWGSHPRWLVDRWLARYGAEETRRLVDANNRPAPLYIRVLGDEAGVLGRLRAAGIGVEPVADVPRAALLVAGSLNAALDVAPILVQDPAAGLVATYADPGPGSRVLDLAAAPGGKALAVACDRQPGGPAFVVAADAAIRRMRQLADNAARLSRPGACGLGPIPVGLVVADARAAPFRPAELVLLDAPCTGTGTLRRHPDARWRIRQEDVLALARLQTELLHAAAALVGENGLLMYSTCSLEPEENERQVMSFLAAHPEFQLEAGPPLVHGVEPDGTLRLLPQVHGWDGAFAARLRRSA